MTTNFNDYQFIQGFSQQKKTLNNKKTADSLAVGSAPTFLRKTFDMINNCDPLIASWSKDGSSFYVKDIRQFTDNILGKYFKHKNLSSFVRMLNFYGFRKIKYESFPYSEEYAKESKHLKFRHEKFQRGRPELLKEICRQNRFEGTDKQEVERLQNDVNEMKAALTTMSSSLSRLSSLVDILMINQCTTSDAMVSPDSLPNYLSSRDMQTAETAGAKRNHAVIGTNVASSSPSLDYLANQAMTPMNKKHKIIPTVEHDTAFPLQIVNIQGHVSAFESSTPNRLTCNSPSSEDILDTDQNKVTNNKLFDVPLDSSTSSEDEILTSLLEDGLLEHLNGKGANK